MRVVVAGSTVKLWASMRDTYDWARRWPGSVLRGKRLFAEFDARSGDLIDLTVNGRGGVDVPVHEFNAFTSDMLRASGKVPADHPSIHAPEE